MTDTQVIHIATETMVVAAKLAGPILLASLGIGLLISIFQSVTQLQDFSLTFVPKLLGIAVVVAFAGHWMILTFVGYVNNLFGQLPHLINSG